MNETDRTQKMLQAIMRNLAEIRGELDVIKQQSVSREQMQKLQGRIEALERKLALTQAEAAYVEQAPLEHAADETPPATELETITGLVAKEAKWTEEETPPVAEPEIKAHYDLPEITEEAAVAPELPGEPEAPLDAEPVAPEAPPEIVEKAAIVTEPAAPQAPPREEPMAPPPTPGIGGMHAQQQAPPRPTHKPEAPRPSPRPSPPPPPVKKKPPRTINWGDVESTAAVWGTRIGAFIVVLGLGYLLSIGFGKLGMVGKTIVVYLACAGMWTTGLVFDRLEKYTVWARIMIAGGWAGLYVTTFLIHYLPQARLIADPTVDVLLLMGLAVGMIVHSFRYRSEALTALCYFIAFITIAMTIRLAEAAMISLVASAVLAVSMLFILYRQQWFSLAMFSLIACYATHAILVRFLEMNIWVGGVRTGTEFTTGSIMLYLYWLTFTLATYIIKPDKERKETKSLWMLAMNFFLFVAVARYHFGTAHPEWRWYFTGSLAVAYIVQAFLTHSWKRWNLYTLNLVIAVLCTTLTLYFKLLGGAWLAVAWLLQAEALYAAGLLGDERRFRLLAIANFALVVGWMFLRDFFQNDTLTLMGYTLFVRTLTFGTLAVVLYLNAIFRHTLRGRIDNKETYSFLFGYLATVVATILLVRNWVPEEILTAAVFAAALGLALMEIGLRVDEPHLRVQGSFFSFLAIVGALAPLLGASEMYYSRGLAYRIGCEAAVIALAYVAFARFHRLGRLAGRLHEIELNVSKAFAAAVLIAVIACYREIAPSAPLWLAFAWLLLGVAFLEIGVALKSLFFRVQGYVMTGLTLVWSLYAFVVEPRWFTEMPHHAWSLVLVIGGLFYLFARLGAIAARDAAALHESERFADWPGGGSLLAAAYSLAGTLILVLLLRQEMIGRWPLFISFAWLLTAALLLEAGARFQSRILRWQAVALAALAFFFALWMNTETGTMFGPLSENAVALLLCTAALYYLYERYRRAVPADAPPLDARLPASDALSWLAGVLLLLLLQREIHVRWPAWVIVAWLAPMGAYFALGLKLKRPQFLLQGLAAALAIFLWAMLATIPAHYPVYQIGNMRALTVPVVIVAFYALFALLYRLAPKLFRDNAAVYAGYARDGFSLAATILLVTLLTYEINDTNKAFTVLAWIVLAVMLLEIGRLLADLGLKSQGMALALAAFVRAVLVNMSGPHGIYGSLNGRIITVTITALWLMYLFMRLRGSREETILQAPEQYAGALFSYLGTALLIMVMRSDVHPHTLAPAAFAGLLVALMLAGLLLRERHLLYQTLVLVVPVAVGVLYYNFTSVGSYANRTGGFTALALLFLARVLWQTVLVKSAGRYVEEGPVLTFLRGVARHIFSVPAAALLVIFLFLEMSGSLEKYLTIAWAGEGLLLMVLGFALSDRLLRFGGLGLLAVCVLKVFFDLYVLDIERVYKVIALIGLGGILILTGWFYSRYRAQIKKLLVD
ncbi:MAG TPA: DUF2339 domain-containing protein [bacterium]|nr:DUF2339 domain-containing protein [bacterium]